MSTDIEKETAEARLDLQAVYAEMFPHRNPADMRVNDDTLAAVVLCRRERALLERRLPRPTKPTADPEA